MEVSLVMFKADGTRRDFPVRKPRTIIGRTNSCDLRIPVSSVSRQHCEVLFDGQSVKVHDLGSSNGTYHNSIRIQETQLKAGDEIVVGPVVFTIVVDGQPAEIKPVRTVVGDTDPDTASRHGSATPELIERDDELPDFVEPEVSSPTVDLDDPIAALEALSQMDDEDEDDKPHR